MQYIIILFLLFSSNCFASPTIDHIDADYIKGTGFGFHDNYGEGRSQLCWIWDNAENYSSFSDAGWTESQCVPNTSLTLSSNLTYSGVYHSIPMVNSNSSKYMRGAHYGSGWSGGADVGPFCGGEVAFQKFYARWYYYEEAPFTYETTGVFGAWDMRNNKNFTIQDRDSLYAGGGTGISYSYFDNVGVIIYEDQPPLGYGNEDWKQIWGVSGNWARTEHYNGFGSVSNVVSYGALPNNGEAGHWELWEVEGNLGVDLSGSCVLSINGVTKVTLKSNEHPFDIKGIGIGGYRDKSNNEHFVKFFDDIYIDKTWARVVIGNAATIQASTIREIQIPTTWSDTSITLSKYNNGSFVPGDRGYLFVIDSDGNASAGYDLGTLQSDGTWGNLKPVQATNLTMSNVTVGE